MSQTKKNTQEKNLNNFLTSCALLYLVASIGIGLLLRSIHLVQLPLPYGNLLHTHSHGAFLGWVYLGINSLLFSSYNKLSKKIKLYFRFQLLILPLLFIGFALYGYNVFTIILSSLQIITSWTISYLIIKEYGFSRLWRFNNPISLLIAGQVFQMISSVFPFLLGAVIKTYGNTSVLYYDTIYTYLHFQYNGFFTCSVISLLFFSAGSMDIYPKLSKAFYFTFIASVLLLSAHNYLWSKPPIAVYYTSLIGSILQLISVFLLVNLFKNIYRSFSKAKKLVMLLFLIVFATKGLLQFFTSIPSFSNYIPNNRDLIIAYLHLVLIGMISVPLLFMLGKQIKLSFVMKIVIGSLILSFVGTEVILLFRGISFLPKIISVNDWTNGIFIFSIILFASITTIAISIIKKGYSNKSK